MRKIFILFILSILFQFNTYSQNVLSIVKNYDKKIETNSEYKLLLISSSGCGYCRIALEKIKTLDKKVQIIVIDYGSEDELNKLKLKYDYTFLDGSKIEELGTQNFFPKLFLYNGSNKLIWKKKGWLNRNIRKIYSKTEK